MVRYVVSSLKLHLFFGRIMKEHSFFMEVGFTGAAPDCVETAREYKEDYEEFLCQVVSCSQGLMDENAFNTKEFVTEYTLSSEKKTACLTGAKIDEEITNLELKLWKQSACGKFRKEIDDSLVSKVKMLNKRAIELTECLIQFKEYVLNQVLTCNLFTINYPLLIEHIIREAELYLKYVKALECKCGKNQENIRDIELFWNQIMMEHALFIRGLLDPTEEDLIETANDFAQDYCKLLKEARMMNDRTVCAVTNEIINETKKYRDFKIAGTKGINNCEIRSLILPLLADHVLREANHYLALLEN